MNEEIAVADVGGTNARFARARLKPGGPITLGQPIVLQTSDFPDLATAWRAFLAQQSGFGPTGASFALAGPVGQSRFKLTNADWVFDTTTLTEELALERAALLNDFAAIAHAVAGDLTAAHLVHIAGPAKPLPEDATITVIGPGTGLGIAHFRVHRGQPIVQATEGSHIDFAPICDLDDRILTLLRTRYERVSLERVVSGDGIAWIHAAMIGKEHPDDPLAIWKAGLAGADDEATNAVAHFVATLGRVCGDYALAQGASAVVLAGGIGLRLQDHLSDPAFHRGFVAKGRYRDLMAEIPIKLITHPQPGLLGAAHAYVAQK